MITIEQLFGTLQQSVVATWRKHLRSAKYSKHMALDEFYDEMPDKVDELIEAWMGVNGRKVNGFENILVSKNMGTLKYLQELRSITKQGYPLMNGETELESILDDIVTLIDSTLYKVKELSESACQSLKDYISESLINESRKEYTFVFQHDNPEAGVLIKEPYSKVSKLAADWDLEIFEVVAKSDLIGIMWNDESSFSWPIEGNNINTAKRLEIAHLEQELSKDAYLEEDGSLYIESKMFGMENEWYDMKKKPSGKDVYDMFKSIFDESGVDGDSGFARSIIDLKKEEVVLGNEGVTVFTWEEFQEAYGYSEED